MSISIKELARNERSHEFKNTSHASDKFKKTFRETPVERKKDKEKHPEEQPLPLQSLMATSLSTPLLNVGEVSSASGVQPVSLPQEIEALYEKMAGTMILLTSSTETETSITLNAPQFSSSPFYGTHISIKEFSTAPKAFNIEIASSSAALALLEPHKAELLAFFEKGNFNFSIGRLSTYIQESDRPLFHRKEAVSQDDDRQEKESQQ